MGAAATPVTNHREAELALRELRSAGERVAAELVAVEDSPGRRFLDGAMLSGVTLARWTAAKTVMGAAWAHYAQFQQVLTAAEGTKDLVRLTTLLRGPAVSLPDLRQVTLAELLETMTASCREVREIVSAADAAWSQVGTLDRLDERLRSATAIADELGVPGPAADTLATVRAQVLSDPLSLPQNDTRLAELDSRLAEATVELTALRRLRDEAEPRIAQLRESVRGLAAAFDTTRQLVATAQDKIAGSLSPPADPVPSLRLRIDALAETRDLARLARGIEDVTQAITTAAGQLDRAADNARELLDRRAELRGRLDAYRIKAARLGHSEDPALTNLHRQAQDLLWHAPCDLAAATRALNAYQRAISDREAAR
ncbi:hypothetical protein [Kutzneria sp. CA-103260]|uniref:hypothetical protein n=1 Tax=Kutzneria sp. CA-103260 TaxID=2802641 RepID=UPI001BAB890D|nr:hypothetical protein [Kutzneria sp. CA-103260]